MGAKKRVAIYTSSFPPKSGGIAAAHYNLFSHFSKSHDVKAFVFADASEQDTDKVVRGRPFPGQKRLFRSALRRLLKQPARAPLRHIDSIADTAASVVRLNGPLKRFDPDLIICPDFDLPALMMKKPRSAKLAWMARHNYLRFTQQPLLPAKNWDDLLLAHRLERRALRKADLAISPSQYMIDVFDATLGKTVPKYVAKNFMSNERVNQTVPSELKSKMNLADDVPLIYIPDGGTVAKGSRYTYEIVRRLARTRSIGLYISGRLPTCLSHELDQIDGLSLFAPGQVPYQDNLANVASCDFTVSPTLVENLSNALIESMTLGVPVVTFDTGGNREIVLNGQTGFVVPYADVEALIECCATLLLSPQALDQARLHCRDCADKIVDVEEIMSVYEDILATSETP